MALRREFDLQVIALGMVPQPGRTLDGIWDRACRIAGSDQPDLDDPRLAALWSDLRTARVDLDWPRSEYHPERSLQKRTLLLAQEAVAQLGGAYPEGPAPVFSERWRHLFLHGKLGLMAALFALERSDQEATVRKIAPLIEGFAGVIEKGFEELLRSEDRLGVIRALRLPPSALAFDDLLRGRLQPFSLARGLYLEEEFAGLRPLAWWVMHERYIPDLPPSCQD